MGARRPLGGEAQRRVDVGVDGRDDGVGGFRAGRDCRPDLLKPLDAMPATLRAHLRYPEDLFTAQNEAYLLYHLDATRQGAAAAIGIRQCFEEIAADEILADEATREVHRGLSGQPAVYLAVPA